MVLLIISTGDGIRVGLELSEGCDDGNSESGDGCSDTCEQECGYSCGDTCVSTCGDGLRASNEQCDDGDNESGDGCSEDCKTEAGFKCVFRAGPFASGSGTSGGSGSGSGGGDGSGSGGLQCGHNICSEIPGDGVTVGGEVCDDGNFDDGDGCNNNMELECGFLQVNSFLGTICGDGLWAGCCPCYQTN
jgi:cysteine-rich repeat protein